MEQRNRDLLKKPFGTRSEKRGRCNGRGAESGPGGGSGGEGEARRKHGGQPGSVAHGRLERSGLAVREEVWEPEAASCRCPECGRNGTNFRILPTNLSFQASTEPAAAFRVPGG